MTNPARQIQLENTLRLISAATSDQAVKALALDVLGESSLQARDGLGRTCWAEHMDDLRGGLVAHLAQQGK